MSNHEELKVTLKAWVGVYDPKLRGGGAERNSQRTRTRCGSRVGGLYI
jgi:hypothetical protein